MPEFHKYKNLIM